MSWGVRTMPSVKSFFSPTLYLKNATRFWPLWAVYLVIWLVALPASLLVSYRDRLVDTYTIARFASTIPPELLRNLGIPLVFSFSIATALATFSYLCNSRASCMIHALPIRRETLFFTNYLSGLSFFILPNLVVFLLMLLTEAATGSVDLSALGLWLLGMTLLPLFFYSFAVFCAMVTGNLMALASFYCILNFLGVILAELIGAVLSTFVFGFQMQGSDTALQTAGQWLTPCWSLLKHCQLEYTYDTTGNLISSSFSGVRYLFLYAGIGVLLAIVSLLLYRRRRMERAGDTVTVSPLRPVFRYGFAFCTALSLGLLLYAIFFENGYSISGNVWGLLTLLILSGALGYFAAEMMLQKSFRVFSKWKGCVIFLLCLTALTISLEYDLLGYEHRVPSADEVESVSLTTPYAAPYDNASGTTVTLTDPELIEQVISIHQTIIAQKQAIESQSYEAYYSDNYIDGKDGVSVQVSGNASFSVTYQLKNGLILTRSYDSLPVTTEALLDPDSYAAQIQELVSIPEVAYEAYFAALPEDAVLSYAELGLPASNAYDYDTSYLSLDRDESALLYDAVLADLDSGALSRRYLLEDETRFANCYFNDIVFMFSYPNPDDPSTPDTYSITITLQTTAANTLAVLGDDVKDELITMDDYMAAEENETLASDSVTIDD
ncbi:MAG: hypothetical protein H6Q60_1118 [Oscillospiraceae bacterium]|nr:hypothetical protein [Oscillospiraceae bacterium]